MSHLLIDVIKCVPSGKLLRLNSLHQLCSFLGIKLKCVLVAYCLEGWMVMVLQILRLSYGAMLIAVLFLPFGLYNTMAEPYVSGAVWGFMLPVGYIAATSGLAVIFYPRSKLLRRLGFSYLLMAVGVSLLLSLWLYPRVLSISLLHGTKMIDTDYSTFFGAVFWLSLLSVVAGIAIKMKSIFLT